MRLNFKNVWYGNECEDYPYKVVFNWLHIPSKVEGTATLYVQSFNDALNLVNWWNSSPDWKYWIESIDSVSN